MRHADQLRSAWDTESAEPISDFVDFADHVLIRIAWRTAGHGPAMQVDITLVYTLRKRGIFLVEYFWDHSEALEAVGLTEQDAHAES
jgi:hypothetical protein